MVLRGPCFRDTGEDIEKAELPYRGEYLSNATADHVFAAQVVDRLCCPVEVAYDEIGAVISCCIDGSTAAHVAEKFVEAITAGLIHVGRVTCMRGGAPRHGKRNCPGKFCKHRCRFRAFFVIKVCPLVEGRHGEILAAMAGEKDKRDACSKTADVPEERDPVEPG